MAKFRKNETIAAKRRVSLFVFLDDGSGPVPLATDWNATKATVALVGTHAGTVRAQVAGLAGSSKTFTTVADGTGAGNVTHSGNAYTFHYQSGVTTMTQMASTLTTEGTLELVPGSFTGANVLAATGDTQGPLALAGGYDLAWAVRAGGTSYAAAAGTFTNTGIDGEWIYEATQAELNFVGSEFGVKVQRVGFSRLAITTCEMNDAADFDSLDENGSTYGDTNRLKTGILACLVQDFGTGVLAFKSLDNAKTRITGTTDSSGRIAKTIGDLTP